MPREGRIVHVKEGKDLTNADLPTLAAPSTYTSRPRRSLRMVATASAMPCKRAHCSNAGPGDPFAERSYTQMNPHYRPGVCAEALPVQRKKNFPPRMGLASLVRLLTRWAPKAVRRLWAAVSSSHRMTSASLLPCGSRSACVWQVPSERPACYCSFPQL